MILDLHRYDDITQMESEIIYTSPAVNSPDEEDLTFEVDENNLYFKSFADLLVIDKASGNEKWAMSVGEALQTRDQILDNDDSYTLQTVVSKNKVYALSNVWNSKESYGLDLVSVFDAETGEVLENMEFEPVMEGIYLDGDNVLVFDEEEILVHQILPN